MSQTVPSKSTLWIGRVLSAIPVLLMGGLGLYALLIKPEMTAGMHDQYGYPTNSIKPVLIAEITCTILYAIPQTSVLGAVLLTGYLGGAVATHVRAGEPFWFPLVMGVIVWLGLFLRDERVRTLMPIRL